MKLITKIIIIISFALSTLSCRGIIYEKSPKGWPAFESRPFTGVRGFPSTDSDYGRAFRDGCGTAWDAVTKGLTSDISPKAVDSEIASKSADYQMGWFDGFEQCTYIVDWDVV